LDLICGIDISWTNKLPASHSSYLFASKCANIASPESGVTYGSSGTQSRKGSWLFCREKNVYKYIFYYKAFEISELFFSIIIILFTAALLDVIIESLDIFLKLMQLESVHFK